MLFAANPDAMSRSFEALSPKHDLLKRFPEVSVEHGVDHLESNEN